MNEHCREVLTHLRHEINVIRDSPFSAVRDAVGRMLTVINTELASKGEELQNANCDPATLPSAVLLHELGKRIRKVRHVQKLCSRCKQRAVRAREMCTKCYKKAYRRGEIRR